jgi:hypothetical protein
VARVLSEISVAQNEFEAMLVNLDDENNATSDSDPESFVKSTQLIEEEVDDIGDHNNERKEYDASTHLSLLSSINVGKMPHI